MRKVLANDSDQQFNLNKNTGRYGYIPEGARSQYYFKDKGSLTLCMLMRADQEFKTKQYLFETYDKEDMRYGLFIDENKELCIEVNSTVEKTGLMVNTQFERFIGFSY